MVFTTRFAEGIMPGLPDTPGSVEKNNKHGLSNKTAGFTLRIGLGQFLSYNAEILGLRGPGESFRELEGSCE
jgi:hypothetical protein